MSADVIAKATGNVTHIAGNTIDLDSPAVVRLDLDRSQVASIDRQGEDLVVRLTNGETIRVADFYQQQGGVTSDLVLREGDQGLWVANPQASGAARFAHLNKVEELLGTAAAETGGGGGGALLPILLGVAGAGGLAAVAAGGGGSRNPSAAEDDEGRAIDNTPPGAPTATFTANGTRITGMGEAGATLWVRDANGNVIGTATAGADGTYSVALNQPRTDGERVTVTQTDATGNLSPATNVVAPDLTAPPAPTAQSNADGTVVTGLGQPGATVTVREATGAVVGTATVDAQGNYAVTLTEAHADGMRLTVTQADAAGNQSPATSVTTPDLTLPDAPTAAVAPDGATVSGTGEPGATVIVRDDSGQPVSTGTVGPDGTYTAPLPAGEADGGSLSVTQTDPAGNTSPPIVVATPDLVAPDAPTVVIAPDGTTASGIGEPGATVTITGPGGVELGSVVVGPDGIYVAPLEPAQANGETVNVVQTDPAGNPSPTVTVTAPDVTAPAAPSAAISADGATVTGIGEAGATIQVRDPAGNAIGTAVAGADGSYSATLSPAQANGGTLQVSQVDGAGNPSPATPVLAPDVTAPVGLTAALDGSGTIVSGIGEPGAEVTVRSAGGAILGTANVGADGDYTVILATAQRNGETLAVTQTDAANNPSAPVTLVAPDLVAPTAPSGVVSGDGLSVNGIGEPGATVTVRGPSGVVGTALVAADGSYSAMLTAAQANGQTLQLTQADAAGNVSPATAVLAPDTTAPLGLTAGIDPAGVSVTGAGEPGATVTVRNASGVELGTGLIAANGSYTVVLAAPQLNGEVLRVTQADPAGNGSSPVAVTAPDLTAPTIPTATVSPTGDAVVGRGEPGATVTVRDANGATIGTARVDADGNYAAPLTPAQTNGEVLDVRQADPAGNPSPSIAAIAPDFTAPIGLTATVNGVGTIVSGLGEPGATVTVRDPLGAPIGSAVVAANGAYAVVLTATQANGETLQVTQTDGAGNPSAPTPALAPDITPPAAPVLTLTPDGTAATGTGEPGATVTVTDANGGILGSGPVDADGNYTIPLAPPQANGETVLATQVDGAGNVSAEATVTAPDVTLPDAPTASLDPTGAVVSGTGEPGATVIVRDAADTIIGSGLVDAQGNYSIALNAPQIDSEELSVTQADAVGNVSPEIVLIAPDLTAPLAPAGTVAADGASITGTGEIGATVVITDPVGLPIGTAVVGLDGTFTAALAPAQINGEVLGLTQTDVAGNVSPEGSAAAPDLVLNDTPPPPTAIVAADGASVSGTGEVGDTIRVSAPNGALLGVGVVGAGGTYVVALTTPQLNGETLRVTQVDAEGDVSPPATAVAPDLTPPAAPLATIDDSGLIVSGTGEVGATVRVTNASGTVIGTAVVNANGNFYTAVLTSAQVNGQALTVTQVDAAGNISAPAAIVAPDFTAPTAPSATVSPDGLTVTGIGEPGATVTITNAAGTPIGTALVAPNGSYTATLGTPQLNGQALVAVQADAAGNVSPATALIAPDITAPAAPTATVDASGLVVSGTGEPGATVTVRDPLGTPIATAVVGANGAYSAGLPIAQLNGQLLQVTQADAAGNASPPATAAAPDVTPPAAPTGVVSADGANVVGTGEPGATVTIRNAAGVAIGTALVAGDGSYSAALASAQVNGERLSVTQSDPAGNLSPQVPAIAPDLTPPALPVATVNAAGTIVSGTGEVGATVTVRDPAGVAIGTAVVASNGAYSAVLTTPQLNGQALQVTQADAAGNVSPPAAALAPDITPPAAPTAVVNGDGTVVTGSGEAGATVRILDGAGNVIGTAPVAIDGTYSATLTAPQANGQTLQVTQADAAGNVSPTIAAHAPDITPPALPAAVAINEAGTVVTGRGEPNATVEVRDAGGTVIGSTTVAANGSFAVVLGDPQTAGEALSVSQRDPAGNQSGAVPVTAPFDIDAFDNFATASIDLAPVTSNANLGSANYVALVSLGLLNLDAQVLGVPSVQFTVAPGHTLDATFTYDAVLNLGVVSGYSVIVQRFDGTNWVAIEGPGNNSLLQLGLLGGNLVANEALDPGQYRAFVTFEGTLGVGLLGTLNVTGVDTDYTDVAAMHPAVAEGNVILDPGAIGEADIVSAQTHVHSVTIGGVTTLVTADGTVVDGAWGTLVIDRDGSYSYTPDANASAIGGTESFTYTLIDPSDGELENATLTIAIGSPDITGTVIAENDIALATARFENVVTTSPAAVDSSFNTPTAILLTGARTGSVTDSFTVGPHSSSDVTLTAVTQNGLSVLPSYTITVTNPQGQVVGTVSQTAVAGTGLGSGVALTLQDLPSGTYSYTVSSTNLLGTGYGTSVYVGQTVTHLDQFAFAASTSAQGNLTDNDAMGGTFAAVRVETGGHFVEVGDAPVTITGLYGTLTVDEVGHYTYQPSAGLAYSGADPIDSFTYQLVQPNGTVDTAQLNVTIDINNGVAPTFASVSSMTMMAAHEPGSDVVPLAMFAEERATESPTGTQHASLPFTLDEGGSVEDLLSHYMHDWKTPVDDGQASLAVAREPADMDKYIDPVPTDPLGYLLMPDEVDHQRMVTAHVM